MSYIFNKIVACFNSWGYHEKEISIENMLLNSPSVLLLYVVEKLFFEGWEYFKKYQDKNYSLTDCIFFIIMKKYKKSLAYGFDEYFKQAGFLIEP